MIVDVTPAAPGDIPVVTTMYRRLATEMAGLRPIWPLADGIAEPLADSLDAILVDPTWMAYIGRLDGVAVGFLLGHDESLLPQAGGERVGAIRYIYTDHDVREVGVGEAMVRAFLADARDRGIRRFDAHVSPGHREAKNFFESHGFKARSIVMHRNEG